MLWPERALRPTKTGLEFDSQEVSYFPIDAVAYTALQFPFRVADLKRGLQWDGTIYLDTRARERDVFEIGHRTPYSPILVLPADVYEIGTQHPRFHSAVLHMFLISACQSKRISEIYGSNHLTPW
jgi:hypothetical protein